MDHETLVGIAAILILGILAQWLSWKLRLPSILLLLLSGFAVGRASGFLDPDALMGRLLFPMVSISVALILFEGGLSLHLRELREIGRPVRNLISLGAAVTWLTSTVAARFVLGFEWSLAVLLGAILIVTGPTVIGPMLRHIRPSHKVGSIARWEGITIDPIGAVAAVLVFEALMAGGQGSTLAAAPAFLRTFLVGLAIGMLGAVFLVLALKNYWIPDFLQNAVSLTSVVAVFTASNLIEEESGLVAVTLMGVALVNQPWATVKHIIEFKENLRVLLISALFILLAARLSWSDLSGLRSSSLIFLAVLIFVARPLCVLVSSLRTSLNWKERVFLAWLAPRGIVAAAVASVFSLRLSAAGYARAEELVSVTFLVIVATAAIYGLTAKPLATWLGLTQGNPQGFLLVGAHAWGIRLAKALEQAGFEVLLADSNRQNIANARLEGLPTYYGNILAEQTHDELDLTGIGRVLALTANDEANSLACLHFIEEFGREHVYQLPRRISTLQARKGKRGTPRHLSGRYLFHPALDYAEMTARFTRNAELKPAAIDEETSIEDLRQRFNDDAIPLFIYDDKGLVQVATADGDPTLQPGDTVIALVGGGSAEG